MNRDKEQGKAPNMGASLLFFYYVNEKNVSW